MADVLYQKEWFDEWFSSPYYEQLYASRNIAEADAFLQRLIHFLQPPPGSRMLDVACGKGRYSQVLAEMGFQVTGIDLSRPFIAAAKKQEKKNLHFFVHDMRYPFRENYFDYAFNFFTSFGYFQTIEEHYDALKTIALSLLDKGIFVIDYLNVPYASDQLKAKEVKTSGQVNFQITRWQDPAFFYKQVEVDDRQNCYHHRFTEKVLKFTLPDFRQMLAWHKMYIRFVFGDYNLGPYKETNSPRLILIASK